MAKKQKNSSKLDFLNRIPIQQLRLLNFAMVFAIVGIMTVIFSIAALLPGFYGSFEKDFESRTNAHRASIGRSRLQHVECLNTVAENYAKFLADNRAWYHNPNLGADVNNHCKGYWVAAGENLARHGDVAGQWQQLLASPGHKANIESGSWTRMGVGAYVNQWGEMYSVHVYASCSDCSGGWNTPASLPADPQAAPAPAPSIGTKHYLKNITETGGHDITFSFGNPADVPLHCDWNADGSDTVGVYRRGVFYLSDDNRGASLTFGYGAADDIPICGDWNADGKDTIGVYRQSNATFYLRNSNTSGVAEVTHTFGNPGDKPLVGDWDGNRSDTIGIHRGNTFYLSNDNRIAAKTFAFGDSADKPIVGDWNGDGFTSIGIWRKGTWFIRNELSSGPHDKMFGYGNATDYPVTGDWNGDKTETIGIVRP